MQIFNCVLRKGTSSRQTYTHTHTNYKHALSDAVLELKIMPSGHIWVNYSALPLGLCTIWTPIAWWYLHNSPNLSGGEASASHLQHEEDRDKRVFSNPWQLMRLLRNCKGAWLELQLSMQHMWSTQSTCFCNFIAWGDKRKMLNLYVTNRTTKVVNRVGGHLTCGLVYDQRMKGLTWLWIHILKLFQAMDVAQKLMEGFLMKFYECMCVC